MEWVVPGREVCPGVIIEFPECNARRVAIRDEPRTIPGVNWFRRGLQSSLGHAEALVLVKLEQSQT